MLWSFFARSLEIFYVRIEISDDTAFTGLSGNTWCRWPCEWPFQVQIWITHFVSWYPSGKELQHTFCYSNRQQTKSILEEFRNNEGVKRTLTDSFGLAEGINFLTEFEPQPIHMQQKKQRFFCTMDETHPFRTPNKGAKRISASQSLILLLTWLTKDFNRCSSWNLYLAFYTISTACKRKQQNR